MIDTLGEIPNVGILLSFAMRTQITIIVVLCYKKGKYQSSHYFTTD